MRKTILHLGACIMLLLMATACSNNAGMTSLLEKIPENTDLVVVGDVKTVVESMGGSIDGSQIKLPSFVTDELSSSDGKAYDDAQAFLKNSGVNPNACALAFNYKDKSPIIVFAVNDESKFKKALDDENFKEKDEEDGVLFYSKKVYESSYNSDYDDYTYVGIKDSYAYLTLSVQANSDFKPMKAIGRFIENAKEKSYASTSFGDYITSGNAFGLAAKLPREFKQAMKEAGLPSNMADLYDGVIGIKGDLTSNAVEFDFKLFDEDGNVKKAEDMPKLMDWNAKINSKALAYMNKDEFLVFAMSCKNMDWDAYFDMVAGATRMGYYDRSALTVAKSYLEKIDGTMAVGFGLKNGVSSITRIDRGRKPFDEMSLTIVCETKEGKAKGIVNDIKTLLEGQGMDYSAKGTSLTLTLPGEAGAVYMEAKDNLLILSTQAIKEYNDNEVVKGASFGDYIAVGGFALNKNNPLASDIGLDYGVKVYGISDVKAMEGKLKLEIDGGDSKGVLEKLIRTCINIADKGQKKMESAYEDLYNEPDLEDEVSVADTVVAEELDW